MPITKHYAGQGCKCCAQSESECNCDVDWTDPEVYELRAKVAELGAYNSRLLTRSAKCIDTLEDKVARLEARGIEDMQNRIDELEAAIAQHKRESLEMKDYTRVPAYRFENTKLWQVIE
jgi:hypothetical protein